MSFNLTEMAVEKFSPALYGYAGYFSAFDRSELCHFRRLRYLWWADLTIYWQKLPYLVLGSGIGWMLAIVALAGVREKMKYSNVPATACADWELPLSWWD
jgi:Na+-transporting NADH:ubiquinone oxidoreductase subunit E